MYILGLNKKGYTIFRIYTNTLYKTTPDGVDHIEGVRKDFRLVEQFDRDKENVNTEFKKLAHKDINWDERIEDLLIGKTMDFTQTIYNDLPPMYFPRKSPSYGKIINIHRYSMEFLQESCKNAFDARNIEYLENLLLNQGTHRLIKSREGYRIISNESITANSGVYKKLKKGLFFTAGQKVKLNLKCVDSYTFKSPYGLGKKSFRHTFDFDGNEILYVGTVDLKIKIGREYNLVGKIKHIEFTGKFDQKKIKMTRITHIKHQL